MGGITPHFDELYTKAGIRSIFGGMDDIPEFLDVLDALQGKAAKWMMIGLQLYLSTDELDIIKANSHDVGECLTGVVRKWQTKTEPRPTWRAIINALRAPAVGEDVLAKELEGRYGPGNDSESRCDALSTEVARFGIHSPQSSVKQGQPAGTWITSSTSCTALKPSVVVSLRSQTKIQESFATLVTKVAVKLRSKELDLEVFRFFVVNLFPPGRCIPHSTNIITIFEAITENELWNFWHYSPVEKIVKEFAPDDENMSGLIDTYKKELSGYRAATSIAEAIEVYSSCIRDREKSDRSRPLPASQDPAYLERLTFKLKTPVADKTLEYVQDLWISIAEYFLLPSLSALLDNIQKGCLEVSWLIPPHYLFQIIGNLQDNASFLRSKDITRVLHAGVCVYDGDQDNEFRKKLQLAVLEGNIDEIVALLTSGIDINTMLEGEATPLMIAAFKGLTEVLEVLLMYGAAINMQNKDGWTALMLACEVGHLQIVESLLRHRADTEMKSSSGWTAVMIACENGHLSVVRMLVDKLANIGVTNKNGHTCLMAACQNGHLKIVELLLSVPQVDVNAKDQIGINAFMYAISNGQVEIAQALLRHPDVDINEISDKKGCTALMYACYNERKTCVELLLGQHANSNIRDGYGWTALMYACMRGCTQIVKLLLSHGVDLNSQEKDGWTALMFASFRNFPEVVQELIEAGADPDIQNKDGLTALSIAREYGHLDVVEQLKDCTKVDGSSTAAAPEKKKHHVQLDPVRSDYRAGLVNRRIFREIVEHGPSSQDPPKQHILPVPSHGKKHKQGEDVP